MQRTAIFGSTPVTKSQVNASDLKDAPAGLSREAARLAREKSSNRNRAISRSPPRAPSAVSKSPARPSSGSKQAEDHVEEEPHEDEQMAFTPNACINLWIKGIKVLKFGRSGYPKIRKFKLDESSHTLTRQSRLMRMFFPKAVDAENVDLSIMRDMKIIRGQKTAQFARITSQPTQYGPLEPISLSISYSELYLPELTLFLSKITNISPQRSNLQYNMMSHDPSASLSFIIVEILTKCNISRPSSSSSSSSSSSLFPPN